MTEYEMADRVQTLASNIIALHAVQASHIAIYLSVVFGFIGAAYLAGAKLTRLQAGITYVVFALFSVFEISRIVFYGLGANALIKQGMEWGVGDDGQYIDPTIRIIMGTGLWSVGAIGALLFMWSVRHPKTE
jgi:uncharacterized protein (DUF486 family)